ncbi:hypothetical protein GCM10025795_32320 [Verticiella sediminum]
MKRPPTLTAFAAPEGASASFGRPCGKEVPPRSLRSLPPKGASASFGRPCGKEVPPTLTAFAAPQGGLSLLRAAVRRLK